MKDKFTPWLFRTLSAVLFLFSSLNSFGNSAISGANLAYTYVSGSTYKVTLTVYANCSYASSADFATLPVSSPHICIYDGDTSIGSLNLTITPPDSGMEINALCPGYISSCTSLTSTIRGLMRFVYTGEYTLPYTSAVWRFIYTGGMGEYGAVAGRAASITNLGGSSIIQLQDTLNNTIYSNSNPTINSIPAGFFLHQYDNYNPYAIDSDGDSLHYMLIQPTSGSGGDTVCSVGGVVSYVPVMAWTAQLLTATTPLEDVDPPPAYNFNQATGQMLFYTTVSQISVVVYNIEEYRAGTMVGASQTELSFFVVTDTGGIDPYISTPYVGAPVISTGCGSIPDTVSVSNYATGCGFAFQWQSSPDSITWTNIIGATDSAYTFIPSAAIYYRCSQTNTITSLTAYSISIHAPMATSPANLIHGSVVNIVDTHCDSTLFFASSCYISSLCSVTTYFGDGTSNNEPLSDTGGLFGAYISHWYLAPGPYTVKQVLMDSTAAIDSETYTYEYFYCRNLRVQFYYDVDSNCAYNDSIDFLNYAPLTVEIDSNGIPVDTMSATSGIYYKALGGPGTVYSFQVISTISGLIASCTTGDPMSDTIESSVSIYPVKYQPLKAVLSTGFDLAVNATVQCGFVSSQAYISAYNNYTTPTAATVAMTFNPKYAYNDASLAPSSIVGNTITWNVGMLSCVSPMTNIYVHFFVSDSFLSVGDTVNTSIVINPIIGDAVPANNNWSAVDTVKASFDPNYITVTPPGCIPVDTTLRYTIHFENTGNDTAHNIYVMDTLSPNLNWHTLSVAVASASMNTCILNYGSNYIAKFDFPDINLLDSAHHDQCDGMLIFNINTMPGLPTGAIILNHAGVFFDDDPAVITATVENIIGGCTTTSAGNVLPISNSIQVYPNPVTNQLTIQSTIQPINQVNITNLLDQSVYNQTCNANSVQVDVSAFPPGVYFIKINGTDVRKFVKE